MGVYKLSANSVRNGRTVYGSMLAGNATFIPTSFESIATVNVTGSATSTVEFTSIDSTYSSLQLRIYSLSSTANWNKLQFNSDTGSNYTYHQLEGNGSGGNAVAASATSQTSIQYAYSYSTTNPLAAIIDILDYTNTNKYKTVRIFSGNDNNGNGNVQYSSGLWLSTNAITSIKFINTSGSFNVNSKFALYGIKGA